MKLPKTEPLQDSIVVPDPPKMMDEPRLQDRLVELVVTASVTFPAKPFSDMADVITEAAMLGFVTTTVGLDDIEKS